MSAQLLGVSIDSSPTLLNSAVFMDDLTRFRTTRPARRRCWSDAQHAEPGFRCDILLIRVSVPFISIASRTTPADVVSINWARIPQALAIPRAPLPRTLRIAP